MSMQRYGQDVWPAVVIMLVLALACGTGAEQIRLNAQLATPVVKAEKVQTAYLQVAMTGFTPKSDTERTPVNVAIVLDKSGSMGGEKIRHAKEAAIMAVERLRGDDIVSVVAYDSTVHVVVPATKAADREMIYSAIRQIQAGDNTALFAGVSKGAHELRKFISANRANRIVLLSDGLANVGPSSPEELGQLGTALAKEGITVATIGFGLGYNEDLMTLLAQRSDGNHMFAEQPNDVKVAFEHEFGNLTSVVAKDVKVAIECAPGVRPVRALGKDVTFNGRNMYATVSQLYADQMKYLLLEVEIPWGEAGDDMEIANVNVEYNNTITKNKDKLASAVRVAFTDSEAEVAKRTDADVMAAVVYQVGMERNRLALELRDQGKVEEAKEELLTNIKYFNSNIATLEKPELNQYVVENEELLKDWKDESKWKGKRKTMQVQQFQTKGQEGTQGSKFPQRPGKK